MSGPRLSIIPARAATDRALKPRDLQVLCVLGRHTDNLGWCMKSQVKMADEMGCARSTVFEAIERLVKAGYLERHVQTSDNGRDSPHWYRVVLDPVHPAVETIPGDDSEGDFDPANPCRQVGTPAGISAPPAGPEPAPPAGAGPAPKNDPFRTTPSEREEREARASEPEGTQTGEGEPDDPRKFERRVKKLAADLNWPGWANSSTHWSVAQFAKLTDAERAAAEARARQYLATTGHKALSLGTYFAERKWTDLPEPEAEKAPTAIEAKPFGPVWGGLVVRELLTIAPRAAPEPSSAYIRQLLAQDDAKGRAERMRRQAQHGWPRVNHWFSQAQGRRGFTATPQEAALGALTEPVPVGSAMFEAWRAEFERRGWPWLPDPGGMPVVYLPAGGPAGLEAFEAAARKLGEGQNHDGGGREAA